MKKALLFFLFLNASVSLITVHAQSMSCQEVFEIVTENYDSKNQVSCYGSSMLTKAIYYKLDEMGFVVAYLKSNEFDFRGKPYIFCGISDARWRSFKSAGMYGSWGESFHEYIMDYTCNCD